MTGIGNVQLSVNLTGNDVHNMRIARTATGMGTPSGGFLWDPTTRSILKREETDKQNDDNLTFLFEYRALLNSRVQTLITQLSNALASDLDVAMNATNSYAWNADRPAMNGLSTNTIEDAGAGRTSYNFLIGWLSRSNLASQGLAGTQTVTPPPPGTPYQVTPPSSNYDVTYTGTNAAGTANGITINARGTAGIVTAQSGNIDNLNIQNLYSGNPTFLYSNADAEVSPGVDNDNRLNDTFNGPLGAAAAQAGAKNLFQKVLFDVVSSIEYKAVLSSGLFKNLVVAASSSLPTGSQAQASFQLTYQGSQDGGSVVINLDKLTCFYHS